MDATRDSDDLPSGASERPSVSADCREDAGGLTVSSSTAERECPSLLPVRRPVESASRDRIEVVIDGTGSGTALSALASETARTVLCVLRSGPKPVSEIGDAADTSLQNARYHVERLCEAGFVEPVDTWYSEKGREMTVYGLLADNLVLRFGSR